MQEKFCVVCYRRVDEATRPMAWKEARRERLHLQLLYPEYFYVIEEVRP
jgi:hypothetical protein